MEKELEKRALVERAISFLYEKGIITSLATSDIPNVTLADTAVKIPLPELLADFAQKQAKPTEPRVYRGRMEAGEE